jgi:hypothetical protein
VMSAWMARRMADKGTVASGGGLPAQCYTGLAGMVLVRKTSPGLASA